MKIFLCAAVALIAISYSGPTEARAPFARPSVIRFGATTAELQRDLRSLCPKIQTRKVDPPFLPEVKTQQLQIDCDGFMFRGRGRHVEFVIRDDRLVMVWLMVEPAEAPGIVRDMTRTFGKPTGTNAHYVAFENARTAWRHKPAEILFYGAELEKDMAPDFR